MPLEIKVTVCRVRVCAVARSEGEKGAVEGLGGEKRRGEKTMWLLCKVEENQINNSDKTPHLSPAISGVRPT